MPEFTVIIATYNWCSALNIALKSVLGQTTQNFEVWVVGDACTDDSAEVVSSFGDERLNWHNLASNCGSQWGPNNFGLRMARGRYIAYLGHDDVWFPTHLEIAQACLESSGADIVAAATLLYGPPESGIRAVTGFFPNEQFSPRHFFPPSSLVHCSHVLSKVGAWYGPENARLAVDYDFLYRCHAAGLSFAMTGEVTVFKFNAAWRRGSYQTRDIVQQQNCLASIQADANSHIRHELTVALRAATEDRLLKIETPLKAEMGATVGAQFNQHFKGSHVQNSRLDSVDLDGPASFARVNENDVFEWHALEHHPTHGDYRWSGPSTRSLVTLPVRLHQQFWLTILVVGEIQAGLLDRSTLNVNGVPWITSTVRGVGVQYLRLTISPEQFSPADRSEIRLTFQVPLTRRPIDLGINADRRWLGLAIGRIIVSPSPSDSLADW
jgi:hypothetical protein